MKKLMLSIMILFVVASSLAYIPNEYRESDSKTYTIAGSLRGCDEYPHKTQTFVQSAYMTCPAIDSLINVYRVSDSGWTFIKEFESPTSFRGLSGQQYAYECYACPEQDTCALKGNYCKTDNQVVSCTNGVESTEDFCTFGEACDPDKGACVSTSAECIENWGCTDWGLCTVDGKQVRSCSDTRSCGTFNNKPTTERSCTPAVVTTGRTVSISDVTASDYDLLPGEAVTIRATVTAPAEDKYMLEAGSGVIGALSIVGVSKNFCDPADKHFANNIVTLQEGSNDVEFTIYPERGRNAFWVAQVSGCGGDVLAQVNSVENILVMSEDDGKTSFGDVGKRAGIVAGALAALAIVSFGLWRVFK